MSGLLAVALAVLAAAFEGVGLLLLVPLLSVITSSDSGGGWTHQLPAQAFDITGAQTCTARLLLGLFAVLVIVRAMFVARRNIMLSQIEVGFVDTVRTRLARRLAGAPRPVVSRLRVAVAAGGQSASGYGRLSGNYGQGSWSGRSSISQCSGHWEAERRG